MQVEIETGTQRKELAMGFDLHGIRPRSQRGRYFGRDVWRWNSMWNYVSCACAAILTGDDCHEALYNDGCFISAMKAEAMGSHLKKLIRTGHTAKHITTLLPEEVCVPVEVIDQGSKTILLGSRFERPFDEESVREFAEFCLDSGGFEIW
jgi:hypothetical protein